MEVVIVRLGGEEQNEKGLMDLLENRSLAALPPEYVPPLEKEDINNR